MKLPPNALQQFTKDELEAELERRRTKSLTAPKMVEKPDWGPVIDTVRSCMSTALSDSKNPWWDEDNREYIYEAVMQAVYGPNYFQWHNETFKNG